MACPNYSYSNQSEKRLHFKRENICNGQTELMAAATNCQVMLLNECVNSSIIATSKFEFTCTYQQWFINTYLINIPNKCCNSPKNPNH